AIEAELRTLDAALAVEDAKISVADTRLRFIQNLIRPLPMGEGAAALGVADWAAALANVATQGAAAEAERLAAETERGALARARQPVEVRLDTARQALEALDRPAPPRSIATVTLTAPAPVSAVLALSYRTETAGWQPIYDLRLGADDAVTLTRQARIFQTTGEAWSGVDLTLSTARPSGRVLAPVLQPRLLREEQAGSGRGASLAYRTQDILSPQVESPAPAREDRLQAAPLVEAEAVGAVFQSQGTTLSFRIADPADVAGDGTVRQVVIDRQTLPATLAAETAPLLDPTAYLIAEWTNTLSAPLLPGPVAIFRDGAFLGQARFPFVPVGEAFDLPFGQYDAIAVERVTLERTEGDFGLIGTSYKRVERYRIRVRNLGARALPVVLTDRVPVSENDDVTVTATTRPAPTDIDPDGRRGLRQWRLDLAAGGAATVELGYTITWPESLGLRLD
ncbi:MAG: DUF4139 domain-containing protein, partial [Pseudomonadota bacterium]